ncbi:MAG TPA: tetraacyldisaccharide 4'-kinase [Flavobacteriales bacterium]|nr:tetraacyldisaccharide 4'-kinase [Flavobacteriales bacterium]HIA10674.1 tetraacyldisaccharide 4'-kinase [Flavobacteriales bacterium]HIO73614.1 tetraacyldisaccharide 4'-kinase [Flavobacteriales bacterium]
MDSLRILLLPFSIVYGAFVLLYHLLYNIGLLPSKKFDIPVISIGNLTVGGTGKTPHVEYILRNLAAEGVAKGSELATLSRGYGRVTSGFRLADDESSSSEIGDEPRQMKQKFGEIHVAVDESRVHGVNKLLKLAPDLKVIVLDDAFQHRAISPGLSILLEDYFALDKTDFMLPAGNLREPKIGAKRADIIVVTNSPKLLSPLERRRIDARIKLKPKQKLFFSYVEYGDLVPAFANMAQKNNSTETPLMVNKSFYFERDYSILLLTGIAHTYPLIEYYKGNISELIHMKYDDHHEYTKEDVENILEKFDNIVNENKIILTTEKDAMRLAIPGVFKALVKLPIFYIPITINFHDEDGVEFKKEIINYVEKNQIYSRVH